MFGAIIIAIVIMIAMVWLDRSFEDSSDVKKSFSELLRGEIIPWAVATGVTVGVMDYLVSKFAGRWVFIAPVAMICLIAIMVYLAKWYVSGTTRFLEFVVFIIVEGIVLHVLQMAAASTAGMFSNRFMKALINIIPTLVSLGCTTSALIALLRYKKVKSGWVTFVKLLAIVLVILNVVSAVRVTNFGNSSAVVSGTTSSPATTTKNSALGFVDKFFQGPGATNVGTSMANLGLSGNQSGTKSGALPAQVPITAVDGKSTLSGTDLSGQKWYGFYNLFMLKDNDPNNDYNFGPDPTQSGWQARDFDRDFRERMAYDPALGAADMAWADLMLGSNCSGVTPSKDLEVWAADINRAKEEFMKNQSSYYTSLGVFYQLLDSATSVEVRTYSGVTNQMFMNPYTNNGVPYVFVMTTDSKESSTFLCYTFVQKGTKVELYYRIPCGYQPCNVREAVSVVPDSPTPPRPTPTPVPPSPPDPPYHKDPTQGTDVGVNDNPGPGPNTNNWADPWHSSVEPDMSSTDFGTYQDYQDAMSDLADANSHQSGSGDNNTPPTSGTHTDDNGASGTGYGSADAGTATHDTHIDDGHGGNVSISDEGPSGAWGGPPD